MEAKDIEKITATAKKLIAQPRIILASQSPRRVKLLKELGVDFEQIPADIDETPEEGELAYDYVYRLAVQKVGTVLKRLSDEEELTSQTIVIGSDLTIDYQGEIIGKPESREEAVEMLERFSGQWHATRNGYAIALDDELVTSGVVSSLLKFREMDSKAINAYLDEKEWRDKAGAYGLQVKKYKFVTEFTGSINATIGLPSFHVAETLKDLGVEIDSAKLATAKEKEQQFKESLLVK